MLELPLLECSDVIELSNVVTEFSNTRRDLQVRLDDTQAKLRGEFAKNLGSLHSMDSANACGALGRGFESLRARLFCYHFLSTNILHKNMNFM